MEVWSGERDMVSFLEILDGIVKREDVSAISCKMSRRVDLI